MNLSARCSSALLALFLVCPAWVQATPTSPSRGVQQAEQLMARQSRELYVEAFKGNRTEEAVRDVEFQLASLGRDLQANAPTMAELMGYQGGMYLAASRIADGEAALDRLYDFCMRGESEVLFYAGVRKLLGVAVYRKSDRRNERSLLEKLLKRHMASVPQGEHPERMGARMAIAIEDCMATADLLDGNYLEAFNLYQKLLKKAEGVFRNFPAPPDPPPGVDPTEAKVEREKYMKDKEALTAAIRIFPLVGIINAQLRMSELEEALSTSDLLVPLLDWLREAQVLTDMHPARRAASGCLQLLGNLYKRYQTKVMEGTGTVLPTTLEERRAWRRIERKSAPKPPAVNFTPMPPKVPNYKGLPPIPIPEGTDLSVFKDMGMPPKDLPRDQIPTLQLPPGKTLDDLPPGAPRELFVPAGAPTDPASNSPSKEPPPLPGGKLEKLIQE